MTTDVGELTALFVRRAPLLRALRAGPRTRSALAADRDVSRSTVDRAVRELESVGAVERHDGAIAITLVGRLALASHDDFERELRNVVDCALLDSLGDDAPIDRAVVDGATNVDATPAATARPLDALTDRLEAAVSVEWYATMALTGLVEAFRRRLDNGLTAHLYVDGDVVDTLVTDSLAVIEDMRGLPNATISETAVELPYDLALFEYAEGSEVVVLTGERGVDHLVCNDSDAAVAWGRERFGEVRADATDIV